MRLIALAALVLTLALPAGAAPRVVASVPPVHGLVAAVVQDDGAPHMLIPADASPHDYALRPSDARALSGAELVFVVGAGLEAGIADALESLADDAEVVRLGELPGIDALLMAGTADAHGAGDADAHGHAAIDPHLWLDPVVAIRWVEAIAAALAGADPANAALYHANAEATVAEITALMDEIDATLAPVRGREYAVFHDAYRYFERRFGLEAAASLTTGAGDMPGARGLARLRERLRGMESACLFADPQHDQALARSLARDSGARLGRLDPLGKGIPPGADFYPALLRSLADGFVQCLGAPS